jgi:hypothetical protein
MAPSLAAVRSLQVAASDLTPDSALEHNPLVRWLVRVLLFHGFVIALGILLTPIWILLILYLIPLVNEMDAEEEEVAPVIEEEDVIEARFVMLGRDFLEELPNREVHVLSTAPPRPAEVPTEDTPDAQEQVTDEERPPEAVEDLLRNIDHRIETLEEQAQRQEMEGREDGIEEGTEQEGSEGDIYRGLVMSFFRRGWSIPTTLAREEAQGLTTIMNVRIGPELQIVSYDVRTSSGNPVFDESVMQQLERLQAGDQRIPPPPEEVAAEYIDRLIVVRFRGRDASGGG